MRGEVSVGDMTLHDAYLKVCLKKSKEGVFGVNAKGKDKSNVDWGEDKEIRRKGKDESSEDGNV